MFGAGEQIRRCFGLGDVWVEMLGNVLGLWADQEMFGAFG